MVNHASSSDSQFEFVDAHLHYWDPRLNHWYSNRLTRDQVLPDVYTVEDYAKDAAPVNVTKVVHVTATTIGTYVDETEWLATLSEASGWPTAIIGGASAAEPLSRIEAVLARQATNPRFRGGRLLHLDPTNPKTPSVLALFGERNWVINLLTDPDTMSSWLPLMERAPNTRIVLEHAGRPMRTEPEYFKHWRGGIAAAAQLDHVTCKIARLPMLLRSTDVGPMRPWVEACIEAFGPQRAFFSSNFPFDRAFGSLEKLVASFRAITALLSAADRRSLFAGTAERIYAI